MIKHKANLRRQVVKWVVNVTKTFAIT